MILTSKCRNDGESWVFRLSSDKPSSSQSVVPGPEAPAAAETLLEMQTLGLHFASAGSETRVEPSSQFEQRTGRCRVNLRTAGLALTTLPVLLALSLCANHTRSSSSCVQSFPFISHV